MCSERQPVEEIETEETVAENRERFAGMSRDEISEMLEAMEEGEEIDESLPFYLTKPGYFIHGDNTP